MRTILLAALFVLAAGATRAGDLSTISSLAQDAQARTAARTAEARSLQTTLERLLSELGVRPHAAPLRAARPAAALADALSGPSRVPGSSPPGRP